MSLALAYLAISTSKHAAQPRSPAVTCVYDKEGDITS